MNTRRTQDQERGFALLAVIILLAVISAAVAITLDEAVGSIQNAGRTRAAEMLKSGLDHGLSQAIDNLATEDPITISDNVLTYDIFNDANPGAPGYMPAMPYPTAGPYANYYTVRVGLLPGQIARPPTGEDVRSANGQVIEVQVSVAATAPGVAPTEERVSVGVLVPRKASYGN